MNRLYVELASFTSAYLAHQDFEEREIMPALDRAIGNDSMVGLNRAIVGSITPRRCGAWCSALSPCDADALAKRLALA